MQCAAAQREWKVTAKAASIASMEHSPLRINFIFSVLIKAILDPAA
jgi:hypothetical protein